MGGPKTSCLLRRASLLIVEALVRKRTLLLPALIAVLLAVSATAAHAGSFVLTLQDVTTGTTVQKIINDNSDVIGEEDIDYLYSDPAVHRTDAIVFSGTVGRFTVDVFGNTFLPGPTGAPAQMNLTNFLVTSAEGGKFTATLERTGISGSLFGSAVVGIANYGANFDYGTVGSVTFQSWVNGNTIFNPQVVTSGSLSGPPPAEYGPIALAAGEDVSLVSTLTFEVNPNGSLQADTALRVETVPEPTTLLLFGPGMLGLAAIRRRLRSKAL
jgi:hypothetical protein